MKKYFLFIIVVISIFLCGCGGMSLKNPDFIMTTRDFREELWNLNEYVAVEKKYNGKVIKMTGRYCNIGHQNGVYTMTLAYYPRPYNLGIYACFDEGNRAKLSRLIPGEEVVIQGTAKWVVYPPDCTLLLTNAVLLKP